MTRHELLDFLRTKSLMVVSTVGPAQMPQSAVVGFGVTDELGIVFRTSNESRKYANLQADQRASLVIGWDELKTVQGEGSVRELDSEAEAALLEPYFGAHPYARKLKDLPDQRFFLVTPTWMRYTDIATTPWTVQTIELAG